MKQAMRPMRLILGISIVSMLAGCLTLPPASVGGLERAAGNSLPGAKGKTRADQIKIDRTVARLCASEIYTVEDCRRHTEASAARLQELQGGAGV